MENKFIIQFGEGCWMKKSPAIHKTTNKISEAEIFSSYENAKEMFCVPGYNFSIAKIVKKTI